MIRDSVVMSNVLIGFENCLKINYKYPNTKSIVDKSIENLESVLQIRMSQPLFVLRNENKFASSSIELLLANILESMKSLSLLLSVSMFDKRYGVSLADHNYLGFAKDNLLTALKYLQDIKLYESRDSFFSELVNSTNSITMCETKRLIIIMAVLERLGIEEGVSLISQYLYLSCQ